ncbi:MAG: extracellular solute-binding protein [Treponema sp.]|nr:extracellular solute-binding protein [Treponema sp.]
MKKKYIAISSVLIIALACIIMSLSHTRKPVVLELGLFTGSNWDVENGDNYCIIDKAISKFEKQHPGVTVHYYSGIRKRDYGEWLSEQIVQGKTPDVVMILEDQFLQLVSLGILQKLDKSLKIDGHIKSWEYFPAAWAAGTYHGEQYAIPYESDFTLMAVNKTLLQKHGLEMPKTNWTWNDFYGLCKAVTVDEDGDAILDSIGVCNYSWQEAVFSNGARLFNENGRRALFSDPKVVEAIRFMQKLSILTGDRIFGQTDFDAGKVAFMPLSFAKYRTYISYPYRLYKELNYEWDCLPMPAGYSGNNISKVDTLLMGIAAHTKQKRLALDLLEMLTHDREIQTEICLSTQGTSAMRIVASTDVVKNLLEDESNEASTDIYYPGLMADILNQGTSLPRFAFYDETMAIAETEITKIILQKKDADNSLRVLQRNLQNQLEK